MENIIIDDLYLSLADESDNETDNESDSDTGKQV